MSYASEVLADSPFGYWHLDETSGTTATDSSGNGNHGTYTGTLALGAESLIGGTGASVTLGGGYVQLGTYNFNGTAGSLEAWVRPNAYGLQFVVGAESGGSPPSQAFHLRLDSTGGTDGDPVATVRTSAFEGVGAGLVTPLNCPPLHLVGVFESSQLKVYTDGVLRGTLNTAGSSISCSGIPFRIGSNPSWASQELYGEIDEVAIYQTALSAARVWAHYAAANPPAPCLGWTVGEIVGA